MSQTYDPIHNAREQISRILGPKALISGEDAKAYEQEFRGLYYGKAALVCFPSSVNEVQTVVDIAAQNGLSIIPQGGNTGLAHGSTPDDSGQQIVMSLKHMNKIRLIDSVNACLVAEAGCTIRQIQEAAQEVGLKYPVSYGSEMSATIGGGISCNSGGIQVLRYGNTRDNILGIEAVMANGRVLDQLGMLRKDNTGFALHQLFTGAEGTLGIVTAASLKLVQDLKRTATAVVGLTEPAHGVALLQQFKEETSEFLTSFEMVPRIGIDFVTKHIPDTRFPLTTQTPWIVLVELASTGKGVDIDQLMQEILTQALEGELVQDTAIAMNEGQRSTMWKLRESLPEAQRHEGFCVTNDISLPISRIVEFIDEMEQEIQAHFPGVRILSYGHVGDGNLHYNIHSSDQYPPEKLKGQALEIISRVNARTLEMKGSISAEHGIGRSRLDELRQCKDPVSADVMRRIKEALDPHDLFNPGILIP